jgi:GTPase SAR1 family protein
MDDFREEIRKSLVKLPQDQIVLFAWRCAVIALPLLGSKGNFNYWPVDKRKKYLYAIFRAIDIAAYADDAYAYAAADDANAAADAYAAYAAVDADADAADAAAAYADDAAATAAPEDAADDAADAAAAAAAAKHINFEMIIRKFMKSAEDKKSKINIDPPQILYGDIWENFLNALSAEGCSYWGKVYQSIFENGLIVNPEDAKLRLNIFKEIQEQGASVVAEYLADLETQGAQKFNEARIIILGEKGAGKTCLARRLIDPSAPMTKEEDSTAGVDTLLWKLKNEPVNVHIWDFAGHVVTHAVHQFFLSERCVYIIVYDGRSEERNRLNYWLDHIKNFGGDSRAFILVNRRDNHTVDIQENNLREKYNIAGVFDFSINNNKSGLMSFRDTLADYIIKNPLWSNLVIPPSDFAVKQKLENLFEKGNNNRCTNFITMQEFDKIAAEIKNKEQLLTNLHALGISLWYKDLKDFNTLVLNPEWISKGVYQIINWANEQKQFSISIDDFSSVFNDKQLYPEDKFKFLFNLMKKYELAYETSDGKNLVIPHLLKEDRPKNLPVFNVGESLLAQYKAETPLPPNVISRFIVRHNKGIVEEGGYLVWRYGVVLKDGKGSIALVRQDDRTISVSVKGDDKKSFFNDLRATLNDIFNQFKSKKPTLQYRIEEFGLLPEAGNQDVEPLWLPDQKIFKHVMADKNYWDDRTGSEISLKQIVIRFCSGKPCFFKFHCA